MKHHLNKLKRDLTEVIPDSNFTGLGVLDWEFWDPLWTRNYDSRKIYQEKSIELVQQRHPNWTKAEIESVAKKEFETAAR